jgi:hypothetical protein
LLVLVLLLLLLVLVLLVLLVVVQRWRWPGTHPGSRSQTPKCAGITIPVLTRKTAGIHRDPAEKRHDPR